MSLLYGFMGNFLIIFFPTLPSSSFLVHLSRQNFPAESFIHTSPNISLPGFSDELGDWPHMARPYIAGEFICIRPHIVTGEVLASALDIASQQ